MADVLVYTTSTDQARRHDTAVRGINRVAAAPKAAKPTPTHGACLRCGAIEVVLSSVTEYRDLSGIGESSHYPIGHGCEVCA